MKRESVVELVIGFIVLLAVFTFLVLNVPR